jgi:hypothetical protein
MVRSAGQLEAPHHLVKAVVRFSSRQAITRSWQLDVTWLSFDEVQTSEGEIQKRSGVCTCTRLREKIREE